MRVQHGSSGNTAARRCLLCIGVHFALLLLLVAGCETGIYHTVSEGQTLYRISHVYGIDETYLARVNGIGDPAHLQIGTRLFVPGADHVRRVPAVAANRVRPADNAAGSSPPSAAQTQRPPATGASAAAEPRQPEPAPPPPSAARAPEKLKWPARGDVLRSFSARAQAGAGRGIEIALAENSPVVAAEAGKVIYSGNGVAGYGHLVIIQHTDELFTVYGFNRQNLVKQGRFVSRGERIALSGVPPSGGRPRLHFEVRKGKQPVDPLGYLP